VTAPTKILNVGDTFWIKAFISHACFSSSTSSIWIIVPCMDQANDSVTIDPNPPGAVSASLKIKTLVTRDGKYCTDVS
jgi:hypothetical protein